MGLAELILGALHPDRPRPGPAPGSAETVEAEAVSPPLSPGERRVVSWYPRLLGLIAYLCAISILATTHGVADWLTLVAVALAAVYLVAVWKRTAIGKPRFQTGANWKGRGSLGLIVPVTVGLALLTAAVGGVFALADPVAYGFTVGSAPVLFLALASILPAGRWRAARTRSRSSRRSAGCSPPKHGPRSPR